MEKSETIEQELRNEIRDLLFENNALKTIINSNASELQNLKSDLFFQNKNLENEIVDLNRIKTFYNASSILAKIGGWEIDVESKELFWSDMTYQIHEVDSSYKPTIESAINFYTPEAIPVITEFVNRAINEGKSFDVELQIITAKQNKTWVRAIGQAQRIQGRIVKIMGVFQDISKQKLIEFELFQKRQNFSVLMDNLPGMVYTCLNDSDWTMKFVSDGSFDLTEYLAEELIDNKIVTFNKIIYPEDQNMVNDIIQQAIRDKTSYTIEYRIITKSGIIKQVWERGQEIYSFDDDLILLEGFIMDITERKQAELTLKNDKLLLRTVIENIPDSIYIKDLYGRKTLVNSAEMRYAGVRTESEIIGKDDFDIYPKELAENFFADDKSVLLTGIPILNREEFLFDENQEKRWLLTSKIPMRDANHQIIGLLGIGRDITEIKHAEFKLIESKEKAEESEFFLKESQKVGLIGSYKTDFISGFWKSSETLDLIFGINEKYDRSIIGWLNIVHPEEQDSLNDYLINEIIGKKTSFDKEYRIVRINDNQTRWVHGYGATTFDNTGKIIQMIGTIQDITEQKINEFELIGAKEKAEESDRLKSAFLANMSHEIRTPMNGILGFADLLKEPRLTSEDQKEYIDLIETSGKRMLNIINDIVDISKIESGQMKVNITQSNINDQIKYIYAFFKPEVEQKGLQIFYKNSLLTSESLIKTDQEKVFAILTNLVKNAIKYSNSGDIDFGYILKGKYLEFFVKDQGIGIPLSKQEIIFERFIQAETGDKRAFQGAGLGLAISKNYVEMLGGKIWVVSEPAKGSTFYFTLPYNTPKNEKIIIDIESKSEYTDNQHIKLKILIAEDDYSSELLISKLLKKIDSELLIVRSGIEAVEAVINDPKIDLILMDVQMPEMSGYEATRRIREFNKEVIIIAQTAYGLLRDRELALEAGCNDYIAKPIHEDELISLILKNSKK